MKHKELRHLVQTRGLSIALAGKGRTDEVISNEAPPAAVVKWSSWSYGTSEDLLPFRCDGWDVTPGDEDVPQEVLCELAVKVLSLQAKRADATRESRHTRWLHYSIELQPRVVFRPRLLGDSPCVAALVSHLAHAPPEFNLAELVGPDAARASGIEVRLPGGSWGQVEGFAGKLGEGGLRKELLSLSKVEATQELLRSASDHEPCFQVRLPGRQGALNGPYTYLGSQLQPRLTMTNAERLCYVMGRNVPCQIGRDAILSPKERQGVIDAELERLHREAPTVTSRLFRSPPARVASSAPALRRQPDAGPAAAPFADRFLSFDTPRLLVGGGVSVGSACAPALWRALEKHGLFRYEPAIGKEVVLQGYILDKAPTSSVLAQAGSILRGIIDMLEGVHLSVRSAMATAPSVAAAMEHSRTIGAQALIFLAPAGCSNQYVPAKQACLSQPAPGLAHTASQWVSLGRSDHNRYAYQNMALQLCAKLGHTPYVLENRGTEVSAGELGPVLCGVDVCHLNNHGKMTHVTAGVQLRRSNGELEHSWICQGLIEGESIPPRIWEQLLSVEACGAREVVIHRDGRFTDIEKDFLAKHAQDINTPGGSFGMVEIVKYAGGTPRLYAGLDNAPAGSFLRLSDTEGILTSGSLRGGGTRNPLWVRTVPCGRAGAAALPVVSAAQDIFRLSLLSYGSLYAAPRLPVTTKTADKAAYFHATAAVHGGGRGGGSAARGGAADLAVASQGRQQYWL